MSSINQYDFTHPDPDGGPPFLFRSLCKRLTVDDCVDGKILRTTYEIIDGVQTTVSVSGDGIPAPVKGSEQ